MARVTWGRALRDDNRIIATHPEVQATVRRHASRIAGSARGKLARHRKTGQHSIEHTSGRVDHHVSLTGPGAVAIETGHHNVRTGTWVDGIHVLRGTT